MTWDECPAGSNDSQIGALKFPGGFPSYRPCTSNLFDYRPPSNLNIVLGVVAANAAIFRLINIVHSASASEGDGINALEKLQESISKRGLLRRQRVEIVPGQRFGRGHSHRNSQRQQKCHDPDMLKNIHAEFLARLVNRILRKYAPTA